MSAMDDDSTCASLRASRDPLGILDDLLLRAGTYAMKPTKLARPPISEALIDLRVTLPPGVDADRMSAFGSVVRSTYPESQNVLAWTGAFGLQNGQPLVQEPKSQQLGFMYRSVDRLQVVQARTDGFTFSRLRPYTEWEQFRNEAKALWGEFCRIAAPLSVQRVALRYINRIEVPTGKDIKDYIRLVPEVPPELPQSVMNLLMRLVVPSEDGAVAVITEFSEQPQGGIVPTVLDIDAYKDSLDLVPASEDVWNVLDELRAFKNSIFFNSLTDLVLESYK